MVNARICAPLRMAGTQRRPTENPFDDARIGTRRKSRRAAKDKHNAMRHARANAQRGRGIILVFWTR